MDTAITIRRARPADVVAVAQCVAEAYERYVDRIGGPPAPMRDDYDALVRRGVVRVAIRGGDVAGVIVAWAREEHFYIDNVATSGAARGSGVGRRLLDWAEAHARALGLAEVRLYTNVAMTENLEYYERRGFVETHRGDESGYTRAFFSKVV